MAAPRKRDLKRYDLLLRRELKLLDAEEDPIAFSEITMPVPKFPDDPDVSRYTAARHHHVMAEALKRVETGEYRKVIITIAPRHGKTELMTRRGTTWLSGKHPDWNVIVGTYNETFAGDIGRQVRDIVQSNPARQVFPELALRKGSEASDRLVTTSGGELLFVGRGGTVTGRGANVLILDDPFKGSEEANSPTIREKAWTWFVQDFLSRRMDDDARVIIIMTRWHEDDIVGRLTDPSNPCYKPKLASGWKIIDMPALAVENDDVMGRKLGEPLWPERFGKAYLEEMREADPTGFNALYQCRPAPEDGAFYRAGHLVEYEEHELPPLDELRIYAASDHAVGTLQTHDRTALGLWGVDKRGVSYLLPQTIWRRMDAEQSVEAMLGLIRMYRPLYWWAERGHITKSIGPFLRRRMREEGVFCSVIEVQPVGDKMTRAQSMQARAANGMVRFPAFAPWWAEAKAELLKFPYARFDDMVDMLSIFGLGMDVQSPARSPRTKGGALLTSKTGELTYAGLHQQTKDQARKKRLARAASNW